MDNELLDFTAQMLADLPCQFRNKERIEGLIKALSRQLNAVRDFYKQLNEARSLRAAAGVQLDGIGNIVCLSRTEALTLSNGAYVMDDVTYRKWLKYKIAINTSHGTYDDIMATIRMLVGDNRVTYTESPDIPATAILDVTKLGFDNLSVLSLLRQIKSAGVKLIFNSFIELDNTTYIAPTMYLHEQAVFNAELPEQGGAANRK